jgi:hypothetical protein
MSISGGKSYAIFNYESLQLSNVGSSTNVFIGYTDGATNTMTNLFSYNKDATGQPASIVQQLGNTSSHS